MIGFVELEEDKCRKLHWHHKWQEITIDELGPTLLCQLHAQPSKSEHHTSVVDGPFPLLHLITTTTIIISIIIIINIINPPTIRLVCLHPPHPHHFPILPMASISSISQPSAYQA